MTQDRPDHAITGNENPGLGAEVRDQEHGGQSVEHATFEFEDLAAGTSCIQIRSGQNLYTLRKTRTGRLVLNK